MPEGEPTYFERERDRLSSEIAVGFEHLLTSSNVLNRKLEEVLGMTKEYDTIASLWSRFHVLMRSQGAEEDPNATSEERSRVDGNSTHNASEATILHVTPKASHASNA